MKYAIIPILIIGFVGIAYADDKSITVIANSPEDGIKELEMAIAGLENSIIMTKSNLEIEELDDGRWKVTQSMSVDNNISYFERSVLQNGINEDEPFQNRLILSLIVNGETRTEAEINHILLVDKIMEKFTGNKITIFNVKTFSNYDGSWGVKSVLKIFNDDINHLTEMAEAVKDDVLSATITYWFMPALGIFASVFGGVGIFIASTFIIDTIFSNMNKKMFILSAVLSVVSGILIWKILNMMFSYPIF